MAITIAICNYNHLSMSNKSNSLSIPAITGNIDTENAFVTMPSALQPWRPTILSYTSSLMSTLVGFPLDTIKTRMQTHYFEGAIDCLRKTVKHEGFKGLFRGATAPLLSTSVAKSMGVSLYTYFKPLVSEKQEYVLESLFPRFKDYSYDVMNNSHTTEEIAHKQRLLTIVNIPTAFISGSITGACVSFFACPFEFTKLYSQIVMLEARRNAGNILLAPVPQLTVQVAKQIVRSEGVLGLYSGMKYHMIRELISSGLYFAVYETSKLLIKSASADQNGYITGTSIPLEPISIAVAGALSGVFSWITIFPIDTVKSLTQRDIVANIIRSQRGLEKLKIKRKLTMPTRRMYRGLGVSVSRSILNSIVFFSSFEYLMKHVA